MTETDKEKIDKALKEIKELEKWWESGHAISLHDNPQCVQLWQMLDKSKKP